MYEFSGEEVKQFIERDIETILYRRYNYSVSFDGEKKTIAIEEL